jgi:hypothetical protein
MLGLFKLNNGCTLPVQVSINTVGFWHSIDLF